MDRSPRQVVPEAVLTTRSEDDVAAGSARLRVLTYVLRYDDLLGTTTQPFGIEDADLPLVIGRATEPGAPARTADALRIHDGWLSGQHAAIERRGDAIVLRDCGSRNGTFVNGDRVTEVELRDHDLIEVGHSLFVYRTLDRKVFVRAYATPGPPVLGSTRTWCPEVASVVSALSRIAPTREPVLVLGESGTGKESTAHAVHAQSGRAGAYRVVDCGAVPDTLFEGTLFGHRKGAFTGALESRVGEIVRADGGTLFVDEIANASLASQAKLLRVIEDGRVTPLGAPDATQVDVRWVSATNRDLFAAVDEGTFRADLLRRLAGYVLRLPPLRQRREDLGELAAHFLREIGIERAAITTKAARALFAGPLPGNIRELRASLRSAALLAQSAPIDVEHLPARSPSGSTPSVSAPPRSEPPRARAMRERPTREELEIVLRTHAGNVVRAASALSTHPRQLYRWLVHYGLRIEDYR